MGHFLNQIQEIKQRKGQSKNFTNISQSKRLSAEERAAINKASRKNPEAILAHLLPVEAFVARNM
jgi:hypothetical protein